MVTIIKTGAAQAEWWRKMRSTSGCWLSFPRALWPRIHVPLRDPFCRRIRPTSKYNPFSFLPFLILPLQWIPENKFVQRLYISALIVPLDNLVDFWAPEESAVSQNGSLSPSVPNSIDSQNRAVILPTRESQDIGRLNATNVINLEGMVTRVRAIQVNSVKSTLYNCTFVIH